MEFPCAEIVSTVATRKCVGVAAKNLHNHIWELGQDKYDFICCVIEVSRAPFAVSSPRPVGRGAPIDSDTHCLLLPTQLDSKEEAEALRRMIVKAVGQNAAKRATLSGRSVRPGLFYDTFCASCSH